MKSLYAQYVLVREGFETVENENGFATYRVNGSDIYLRDIFVTPEECGKGIARDLADCVCEIGRAAGCKRLLGSVVPSAFGSTDSMKVLLHYGMRINGAHPDFITLEKEI
jgi:predicted GNAT family acetyltransferase